MRVPQTSLRSLRKLDFVPAHDGGVSAYQVSYVVSGSEDIDLK
jgi:hypothetical protein